MMKSVVRFFLITMLISLFIISCNDVVKNEKPVKEAVEIVVDDIVTSSVENIEGESLIIQRILLQLFIIEIPFK